MRVALIGYGRMGQMVADCAADRGDIEIAGIVDTGYLATLADAPQADVAIDFSYPGDLPGLLDIAISRSMPLVIGRTGITQADMDLIRSAAQRIPIVQAGNFSLGVTVMRRLVRQAAAVLGADFDVEIVEAHHRGKLDAPSGTANMLLADVDPAGARPVLHGREGTRAERSREIGMHALRGGSVAGEHTVRFLGEGEELSITHRAENRRIFALGALKAAAFATAQAPGLYTMEDVLFGKEEAHT